MGYEGSLFPTYKMENVNNYSICFVSKVEACVISHEMQISIYIYKEAILYFLFPLIKVILSERDSIAAYNHNLKSIIRIFSLCSVKINDLHE